MNESPPNILELLRPQFLHLINPNPSNLSRSMHIRYVDPGLVHADSIKADPTSCFVQKVHESVKDHTFFFYFVELWKDGQS